MNLIRFMILGLSTMITAQAEVADMVIFSYDRPLQLYALLESIKKHVTGIGEISVVYRASNADYQRGFEMVHEKFSDAKFFMQGENPAQDFKPLTLQAIFDSPSSYVIFAVDDIVVKDDVDLSYCIELLERTGAYGFYLRMGENLNYCYTMTQPQRVPPLSHVEGDVYSWTFSQGEFDWNYPNTVDMTIYRKNEIEDSLRSLTYRAPNTLEGWWSHHANRVMCRQGLCFKSSKIVNLPLNRVQNEWHNKSMDISPAQLLETFMQGLKLDIQPLFRFNNRAAHMEYEPTFIER